MTPASGKEDPERGGGGGGGGEGAVGLKKHADSEAGESNAAVVAGGPA